MKLSYEEALKLIEEKSKFGVNLGLQRIEELLRRLGNPHQDGKVRYIHIAGTNGKGSTASFIQQILISAGRRVGFFSSPHLHSYCERIRVNNTNIPEEHWAELVEYIIPHVEAMVADGFEAPTEFEINTAMALLYFSRQKVDWAVMEVGLGGRIDSTNVIVPKVSIITNIAIDHTNYLGDTIGEIAAEKAGIIKKGVPVITGCRNSDNQEALAVIKAKASELDCPLWIYGEDFESTLNYADENSQVFDCRVKDKSYNGLSTILLGRYQIDNAALAVACASLLKVKTSAIQDGIWHAYWPGRMEILSRKPLIVLDGAHNAHGMAALAESMESYWSKKKIVAMFGMLADKDREKAMAVILPFVTRAVVTKVNSPRAGNWQYLAEICQKEGVIAEPVEQVEAAVVRTLELSDEVQADMILVTGSLYMLGDARAFLIKLLQGRERGGMR